MKFVAIALLLVTAAWAKDVNPADFPLKGHLRSTLSHRTPRAKSPTGRAINVHVTEIQIDDKVYLAEQTCDAAVVGQDYPARLHKEQLELLVGNKVCKYRVTGITDEK
jgi:hypothetical protein